MYGSIVIKKKSGEVGEIPIKEDITIGRGTNCNLRIHLQTVSEEHCRITIHKSGQVFFSNISSSISFVNGDPCKSKIPLQHGDEIDVGGRKLQWKYPKNSQFYRVVDDDKRKRRRTIANCKYATVEVPFSGRKTVQRTSISRAVPSLKSLKKVEDLQSSKAKVSTPRTPKTATPKATPKSARIPAKSNQKTGSQVKKRKLSSTPKPSAKKVKIESPKTVDKKKQAAISKIIVSSGVLKSSLKKKTLKTPSVVTKPRRLLFSEVLKMKAIKIINAKAKTPAQKLAQKKKKKGSKPLEYLKEVPKSFRFNPTRHANSPETIFIGHGARTPKGPSAISTLTSSTTTSRLSSPKNVSTKTPPSSSRRASKTSVGSATKTKTPSPVKSTPQRKASVGSSNKSKTPPSLLKSTPQKKETAEVARSSLSSKKIQSPFKESTPRKSVQKSPRPRMTPPKMFLSKSPMKMFPSIFSNKSKEELSTSISSLGKKSGSAVHTSTPSYPRKHLFASASPNASTPLSVATDYSIVPESPASGRKSRLSMARQKSQGPNSPSQTPIKSSLKHSSPGSPGSKDNSKNLSVSFNENVDVQPFYQSSKKNRKSFSSFHSPVSHCSGASDEYTFDFNAIKTPNVPREMFVSSILSSCSNGSPHGFGSAKRKGRTQKSPRNELNDLSGVNRLLKTPRDYMKVKGVKRLSTPPGANSSYQAVEGINRLFGRQHVPDLQDVLGVKKLFCDAVASSRNILINVSGVENLFASPRSEPGEALRLSGSLSFNRESPSFTQNAPQSDKSAGKRRRNESSDTPISTTKKRAARGLKQPSPSATKTSTPSTSTPKSSTKKSSAKKVEVSPPKGRVRAGRRNVKAEISSPSTKQKASAGKPQSKASLGKSPESPSKNTARQTRSRRKLLKEGSPVKASPKPTKASPKPAKASPKPSKATKSTTSNKSSPKPSTSKRSASPAKEVSPPKRAKRARGKSAEKVENSPPKQQARSTRAKKATLSPGKKFSPKKATAVKRKASPVKTTSPVRADEPPKTKRGKTEKLQAVKSPKISPIKTRTRRAAKVASPKESPKRTPKKTTRAKKQVHSNDSKPSTAKKQGTPTISPRKTRSRAKK